MRHDPAKHRAIHQVTSYVEQQRIIRTDTRTMSIRIDFDQRRNRIARLARCGSNGPCLFTRVDDDGEIDTGPFALFMLSLDADAYVLWRIDGTVPLKTSSRVAPRDATGQHCCQARRPRKLYKNTPRAIVRESAQIAMPGPGDRASLHRWPLMRSLPEPPTNYSPVASVACQLARFTSLRCRPKSRDVRNPKRKPFGDQRRPLLTLDLDRTIVPIEDPPLLVELALLLQEPAANP